MLCLLSRLTGPRSRSVVVPKQQEHQHQSLADASPARWDEKREERANLRYPSRFIMHFGSIFVVFSCYAFLFCINSCHCHVRALLAGVTIYGWVFDSVAVKCEIFTWLCRLLLVFCRSWDCAIHIWSSADMVRLAECCWSVHLLLSVCHMIYLFIFSLTNFDKFKSLLNLWCFDAVGWAT